MCHNATGLRSGAPLASFLLAVTLSPGLASAQSAGGGVRPEWRRIGNSAIDLALASPASGTAGRVWFSEDGARLFVRAASGAVFVTSDFENWERADASVAPPPAASGPVRASALDPRRMYAFGQNVLRSDDGGESWLNVTAFRRSSIIGGGMNDLAISPLDPDDVVVANRVGVWRSLDGGVTWSGLNDSLPILPARRLTGVPQGSRGVRLEAQGIGAIEWAPGEKLAWRLVPDPSLVAEEAVRSAAAAALSAEITAAAIAGDVIYAGASDGRIWTSRDKGRTWELPSSGERGEVAGFWVDANDPQTALAALGGAKGARVLRTVNGGLFWDDLTSDLPDGPAYGVAADRASGAVYLATARGVFSTRADLNAAAPAGGWTALAGLPETAARDVRLDADGNQLYVALEGYGVYAALAPHRIGGFRLVNAADFSQRAAAPGSLLSVLGGPVRSVRAGDLSFPVLAATASETQIQVPFTARAGSLAVALDADGRNLRVSLPVENVSPAIFVDRDGAPLALDGDSGVLLDAMNPARSNGRIQVLATGLGRVRPDWPAGTPGPVDKPPQVIAPVEAWLDRTPVEVTRAVLAPGYVGLYLVEIQLPAIVNEGPAELYLSSETRESNRVRIWLEP